jgi:putative PIN family toxin of toxin-antitoxin system
MKVLIDTNVIVSAALKDRGPEQVVLCVTDHPDLEWIASPEILDEYKGVLRRAKFRLPFEILERWTETFKTFVALANSGETVEFERDRKDAKFIACALASDAQFFVTGDGDFSQAQKLMNTNIVSVTLFLRLFCDREEK